jgi:hypothetical protein
LIYRFWLPLWYLLSIVLSVLLWYTDSDLSKKNRQHNGQDTKEAIRICISKKNRQHNGQKIPKGQSESVYQRRTDNTMDKRYQRGNQNLYIKEEHFDIQILITSLWCLLRFPIHKKIVVIHVQFGFNQISSYWGKQIFNYPYFGWRSVLFNIFLKGDYTNTIPA